MESSFVCDVNSEVDYPASSEDRMNRSNTDLECSTPGGDSLDYSRMISKIMTYSKPSSSDEPLHLGWPISMPVLTKLRMKQHSKVLDLKSDPKMMRERFIKLLLGEGMSGSRKGVCTGVAISNTITSLYGNCLRSGDIRGY